MLNQSHNFRKFGYILHDRQPKIQKIDIHVESMNLIYIFGNYENFYTY